jgi:hypothetical protein
MTGQIGELETLGGVVVLVKDQVGVVANELVEARSTSRARSLQPSRTFSPLSLDDKAHESCSVDRCNS